jgi:hypothetical protein
MLDLAPLFVEAAQIVTRKRAAWARYLRRVPGLAERATHIAIRSRSLSAWAGMGSADETGESRTGATSIGRRDTCALIGDHPPFTLTP